MLSNEKNIVALEANFTYNNKWMSLISLKTQRLWKQQGKDHQIK